MTIQAGDSCPTARKKEMVEKWLSSQRLQVIKSSSAITRGIPIAGLTLKNIKEKQRKLGSLFQPKVHPPFSLPPKCLADNTSLY
jgi:hypothetical protein